MNEDVVEEILTYIEFRQLFQMQRISKQFCFCVERLLRRKMFLSFGQMNKSNLCEDFKHKSNYPQNIKISSLVWNSPNIIPIVSKCPNIRCLCLNRDLGLETIKSMAQICERLECLCFGEVFLNTESTHFKTIGNLFAERVVHLSIKCDFQDDSNDEKVIELIRYFTSLKKLKIIHSKPLNNTLNFVPKNLKSLYILNYGYEISEEEEEDITSLMSYIKRNNRCLETLFFTKYLISEELFASFCSHLDLKQLSIYCQLLSLSSLIRILCKTQPNLSTLSLKLLKFENNVLVSDRHYLKVQSLRLRSCQFEVNSFIQFLKLFRFLEKLDISGCNYFRCECDSTRVNYFCSECNQKGLTELAKSKTLKVLAMDVIWSFVSNPSSVWHSLTRIANLKKLKVFDINRNNCKLLAQNLVEVLAEKTTKYFTLELSDSEVKAVFVEELKHICHEMPRNLRIIC